MGFKLQLGEFDFYEEEDYFLFCKRERVEKEEERRNMFGDLKIKEMFNLFFEIVGNVNC